MGAILGIISALGAVPSLISGMFGTVNNITNAISNEKLAVITATTQKEQIAAQERVKTLEARRDLMIAEAGGSRINLIVRAVLTAGPAAVLAKLFIWDKVIGSLAGCSQAARGTCGIFTTDPLDENMWRIIMIEIGFYFLYEGTTAVTRMVKSR